LKELGLKKITIFVCVENNNISWTSLELDSIGGGKQIFEVRPLFILFSSKLAKTWPQICPATPLSFRLFLSYVAEQSAS
jgi:hypothetical protein